MTISLGKSVDRISPPWLRRTVGGGILRATGLALDAQIEKVRQGIKARMPGAGATYDALPYIARDRLYERGIDEADATLAARLPGAFDAWRVCGSPHELLRKLREHFLATPVAAIDVVSDRGVWHSINMTTAAITRTIASPSNWKWDRYAYSVATAGTQRWWRGWVIIDMSSGPWGPTTYAYGDPIVYGGGAVFGLSGATSNDVRTLRRLVATWKPKNMHVPFIITKWDASLFLPANAPGYPMPDGTFGDPTARPSAAAYIGGVI